MTHAKKLDSLSSEKAAAAAMMSGDTFLCVFGTGFVIVAIIMT